jgi:hypothetical protein
MPRKFLGRMVIYKRKMTSLKLLCETYTGFINIYLVAMGTYKFVYTSEDVFVFNVISLFFKSKVVSHRVLDFVSYSQIGMFKQLGDKCDCFSYIDEGS